MCKPCGPRFEHRANGGGGGIRTLVGGLTPEMVFETTAFNRSATPPRAPSRLGVILRSQAGLGHAGRSRAPRPISLLSSASAAVRGPPVASGKPPAAIEPASGGLSQHRFRPTLDSRSISIPAPRVPRDRTVALAAGRWTGTRSPRRGHAVRLQPASSSALLGAAVLRGGPSFAPRSWRAHRIRRVPARPLVQSPRSARPARLTPLHA